MWFLTAASAKHAASVRAGSLVVAPIDSPVVVNHLFLHRRTTTAGRNRTITGAPQIAPMYACSGVINAQLGVKTRAIARAKSLLEAQRRNIGQGTAETRGAAVTHKDVVTRNEAVTHKDKVTRNEAVTHKDVVTRNEAVTHKDVVTRNEAVTHKDKVTRNEAVTHKDKVTRNEAVTHKDKVTRNEMATHSERMKRTHKRKDSTDSEVSNTSSVCGHSSVSSGRSTSSGEVSNTSSVCGHSSVSSGRSTSSGGTVCAADSESDVTQLSHSPATSDSDIAAKTRHVTDLMCLSDAVDGDTGTGDTVGDDTVNGDTMEGDTVNSDAVGDDTLTDAVHGDNVDNDNNESHVNRGDSGCDKEVGGDTDTDSDTDGSVASLGDRRDYCEGAETDTNVDETNDFVKSPRHSAEGEEHDTRGSHLARDDAGEQTHVHSSGGSHCAVVSDTCTTKPGQDAATNSDCPPTLLQLSRGWTPPPPDVSTVGDGKENASERYGNRPQMGGATSPHMERVFNPFPSVHMSQRRARNGVRLGLYSMDNMPKLETGLIVGSGVKQIGRAQINACLHHQYMAGIRQKGRNPKR